MGLLSDDNLCGLTLLRLVARGNSILAELFRLAQNLPPFFSAPEGEAVGRHLASLVGSEPVRAAASARHAT